MMKYDKNHFQTLTLNIRTTKQINNDSIMDTKTTNMDGKTKYYKIKYSEEKIIEDNQTSN